MKSTNYITELHFKFDARAKMYLRLIEKNFKKCSTDYSFISKEFHTQRPAFKTSKSFLSDV